MQPDVRIAAALLLVVVTPDVGTGAGEERFGNEPLSEANYQDWPGIVRVVNHPTRVYYTWVNGNEHCYYSGDTAELNDFLQAFSWTEAKTLEIVLRPAPCEAQTFDGQAVPYDWMLHLVGGIARHMTTREALASKDKTVRGWSAGALAHLDPYDEESAVAIAKLLQDEDDWIRLNAVGALEHYGTRARAALPALRKLLPTSDEQLQKRIESAIEQLENRDHDPKLAPRAQRKAGGDPRVPQGSQHELNRLR